MVTLVERENTASRRIAELICDRGKVDVGHAFFLVRSVWRAYPGIWVVENGVDSRAVIAE